MKEVWRAIDDQAPPGRTLLIVSSGLCRLAMLICGDGPDGPWQAFMDPYTDELLAWPAHWMPLPAMPEPS